MSHSRHSPPGSEGRQLTPGHVDSGKSAVQGLLPRVWVEATLGEVDVDIDGSILLYTLQEKGVENAKAACHLPTAASTYFRLSSYFLRTQGIEAAD